MRIPHQQQDCKFYVLGFLILYYFNIFDIWVFKYGIVVG